jgi:hypothetical protein
VARATDAGCAALGAVSPTRSVTVANTGCGLDLSNWRLVQANSTLTCYLPAGTTIPENGYVIIGRDASQALSSLPRHAAGDARYVNAAGAFPAINGSENFTLYNASGNKVDGRTISFGSAASLRAGPCQLTVLELDGGRRQPARRAPAPARAAPGVVINGSRT